MVLPIGGADMPVVISLLNSFTGTAAAMAGFVIGNPVLIIAGALVGASGAILTKLMADAMNRSIMNIMVGGFGGGDDAAGAATGSWRHGPRDRGGRRRDPARLRPVRDHRAGLRPRGRPGPARRPRAGRAARGARRRRQVRHPSRRRPDARAHERPPRRGQRALSPAQGDGGDQPRVRSLRRGPGHRGQRRHEPGRPPTRLAGVRACRSSTSTTPSPSSSSSARWARATPASTTSSTPTRRPGCSSPTRRTAWPSLTAAVKAL